MSTYKNTLKTCWFKILTNAMCSHTSIRWVFLHGRWTKDESDLLAWRSLGKKHTSSFLWRTWPKFHYGLVNCSLGRHIRNVGCDCCSRGIMWNPNMFWICVHGSRQKLRWLTDRKNSDTGHGFVALPSETLPSETLPSETLPSEMRLLICSTLYDRQELDY